MNPLWEIFRAGDGRQALQWSLWGCPTNANLIMSNHHDFNQPFGSPWKDKLSQLTTKDCCFKLKCQTASRKHLHLIPQITSTGFRPCRSLRRSLWNTRYQVFQLCTSNMLRALLLRWYDGYQAISVFFSQNKHLYESAPASQEPYWMQSSFIHLWIAHVLMKVGGSTITWVITLSTLLIFLLNVNEISEVFIWFKWSVIQHLCCVYGRKSAST